VSLARLAAWVVLSALGAGCVPVRYADCGGGTVQLVDDPQHCDGCHVSCPEGVPCVDGRCAVPEGATVCRDWDDPEGEAPPWHRPEEATCGTGDPTFAREFGQVRCRLADLTADPAHCGACGNACPPDATCVDGGCTCGEERMRCLVPREDDESYRDGEPPPDLALEPWRWDDPSLADRFERRCVDPATDAAHCGGCNRACPATAECVDGACRCGEGSTFCPRETVPWEAVDPPEAVGVCLDLATSQASCGACGTACASAERCVDGCCVPCCAYPSAATAPEPAALR
jgi:hypothetical protein